VGESHPAWIRPATSSGQGAPIDYLDFPSPGSGLGGKIGLDATNKWPPETKREWGRKIHMSEDVVGAVTRNGRAWATRRPADLALIRAAQPAGGGALTALRSPPRPIGAIPRASWPVAALRSPSSPP
jgi:hypothetical protein